jgi:hypothetical protein
VHAPAVPQAKKAMDQLNIKYEVMELDKREDGQAIQVGAPSLSRTRAAEMPECGVKSYLQVIAGHNACDDGRTVCTAPFYQRQIHRRSFPVRHPSVGPYLPSFHIGWKGCFCALSLF